MFRHVHVAAWHRNSNTNLWKMGQTDKGKILLHFNSEKLLADENENINRPEPFVQHRQNHMVFGALNIFLSHRCVSGAEQMQPAFNFQNIPAMP
jgi:hypothetical protein